MRTTDRFFARRVLDAETLARLRMDVQADSVQVSRAMDDAHRLFHDDGHGWNKCELDSCHSVCMLLGDLALLLGDLALLDVVVAVSRRAE